MSMMAALMHKTILADSALMIAMADSAHMIDTADSTFKSSASDCRYVSTACVVLHIGEGLADVEAAAETTHLFLHFWVMHAD